MQQLLGTRVWVEAFDPSVTESGIILHTPMLEKFDKERPHKGKVAYVGKSCKSGVKPGDIIEWDKMAGKEIPYNGVNYIAVDEQSIEGIYAI